MLVVTPGPEFEAARRAYDSYLAQWRDVLERVVDLFLRLNTREAEIAASVHFATAQLASRRQDPPSEWEVWRYIEHWKNDRLQPEDVAASIRKLAELGWLSVRHSPALPGEDDVVPEEEPLAV